jgi:hypothetical protein
VAEINISNSAGRDAIVNMEGVSVPLRVRWLDDKNRQAKSIRLLKSTVERDSDALAQQFAGVENVGQAIINGDPEIDLELTGSFLTSTSRVYVDTDKQLVHRIHPFEIVKDPAGNEIERRPKTVLPQNVSSEIPLRWTGRFIKKSDVVRKFVFSNKLQLMHINGLTYDFLFAMAKELQERDSMMLVGGGLKSNQPLILRRGSLPYRGFLEGRTAGDRYCLLLHLSNLELKSPETASAEETSDEMGAD